MTMIQPIEYNVLVRLQPVEEQTAGGLYKPDSVKGREKYRRARGTIEAVSPMAFAFEDWPDGSPKPQSGDVVVIRQNDGTEVDDDLILVPDRSILAVVKDDG